jgi:hypothetical protein
MQEHTRNTLSLRYFEKAGSGEGAVNTRIYKKESLLGKDGVGFGKSLVLRGNINSQYVCG